MNNYIFWGDITNKIDNTKLVFINSFGEFIGMFIFIFFLVSSLLNFNLKKSKAFTSKNFGWIVIAISLGLIFGLTTSIGIQYAIFNKLDQSINIFSYCSYNLNPVFILNGMIKGFNYVNVNCYIPFANGLILLLFEFIGACLGAYVAYLIFIKLIKLDNDPIELRTYFYTTPAIKNLINNLLIEVFSTMILVLIINSSFTLFSDNLVLWSVIIGLIVACIGYSVGGLTGYALNPFRDLCPRIIFNLIYLKHFSLIKHDWKYAIVPSIGPLIGGFIALLISPGLFY